MKRIGLSLLLAVFCFGTTSHLRAQQSQQQGSSLANVSGSTGSADALGSALDQMGVHKYLLGPGDVLDLRVFGEPQFNGPLVIDDYGNIELPFVDKPIMARCRTDREIRKDITDALSRYLKKPQVYLRVAERRSRPPAVVFGAVRAPSRFLLNRRVRLLEALAQTGGVTEAAGGTIQVFHTEPLLCPEEEDILSTKPDAEKPLSSTQDTKGATSATQDTKQEVSSQQTTTTEQAPATKQMVTGDALEIPFNIYSLTDLKLGKQEANPYIWPGDIVIVQEAAPVYVTGAVVAPQGLYRRDKLSLTTALAMVGGVRKEAKGTEVRIYRQKPGALQPEVITVDYAAIKKNKRNDIELQPYDIIEVPETSAFTPRRLGEFLIGSAMNSVTSISNVVGYRVIY